MPRFSLCAAACPWMSPRFSMRRSALGAGARLPSGNVYSPCPDYSALAGLPSTPRAQSGTAKRFSVRKAGAALRYHIDLLEFLLASTPRASDRLHRSIPSWRLVEMEVSRYDGGRRQASHVLARDADLPFGDPLEAVGHPRRRGPVAAARGPRMATNSPCSISALKSMTARTSPSKVLSTLTRTMLRSATVRGPRSRVVGQEARANAMPAPDGRTESVAHAPRRRLS